MNFQQSPNARQRSNMTPKTPTTPDIFQSNEYRPRLEAEISMVCFDMFLWENLNEMFVNIADNDCER